jgi:phage terminase Nu1 subunit (DNA packaging protein)
MGELVRFPVGRVVGGWVGIGAVARELGVSVRTVERWRAEGCPCVQGRRRGVLRFRLVDVEVWLRSR